MAASHVLCMTDLLTHMLASTEISTIETRECLLDSTRAVERTDASVRPSVRGKFIYIGEQKFYAKGTTYGAFEPDADKREYHDLAKIDDDFARMRAAGMNAVRIPHTMPPVELLDLASRHDLRVMVGLSAEQYVGYLIDRKKVPDFEKVIRDKVRPVAGHPAILCYGLGNEIQASLVRWLGPRAVERYLEQMFDAAKSEDPDGLVTYVNYPTTEYISLPFLDMVSFNVYLESPDKLEAYLARLQSIAGSRPLLMSELGLDAMRNGEARQAEVLEWQIRSTFGAGCAGGFIFSWTDEWFRAGSYVDDWAFGIVDAARRPKLALEVVSRTFAEVPLGNETSWPKISVVVCTYNGQRTIDETFRALTRVEYPDFEVIVVDDGSASPVEPLAAPYGYRVIRTANQGLSQARNVGWQAAAGEIVAYIDDDAYPDPHWLKYFANTFLRSSHAAVGGPNLPPHNDGEVAECVSQAPGGPVHVLLTDEIAEHIPGCNMAVRREVLAAIGGFDPQFRAAGDDVDLCWRIQHCGWTIGFSPAAMVWHHCRGTVSGYLRQQRGYGRAEALLERKWPDKYNAAGHVAWAGRIYSDGLLNALSWRQSRVYHGIWGMAPFQSVYEPAEGTWRSLPLMPEWYLLVLALVGLSILGLVWPPMLWTLPLLSAAVLVSVTRAVGAALRTRFATGAPSWPAEVRRRALTAYLHLAQPAARLWGRVASGLTPVRLRRGASRTLPLPREQAIWCEDWRAPEQRLDDVVQALRARGIVVVPGGEYDRWDLEVRVGLLAGARMLMAVEDHGAGTQYVRVRTWPVLRRCLTVLMLPLLVLAAAAWLDGSLVAAGVLAVVAAIVFARVLQEAGVAMGGFTAAVPSNASAPLRPNDV